MKKNNYFELNIRTLTAGNVKRQLRRAIRKSGSGTVSIAFITKPGIDLPANADILDTTENGGHCLWAKVSAETVQYGKIKMDEGYSIPLSIVDGSICCCGTMKAAAA